MDEGANARGVYTVECIGPDGKLKPPALEAATASPT